MAGFTTPYLTRCARLPGTWDIRIAGHYAGKIKAETREQAERLLATPTDLETR